MTESSQPKIAGLLLAAGGSFRLGRPKQLVEFEGKTLIRRAAEALLGAGCSPVIVVLGAEIERSANDLKDLPLAVTENPHWEHGMSTSIRHGIDTLRMLEPSANAVLISTCDQPKVSGEDLRGFVERFSNEPTAIIAAEYDDLRGVPALFPAEMFETLRDLKGDKGARELIRGATGVIGISLPNASTDVDTNADLIGL